MITRAARRGADRGADRRDVGGAPSPCRRSRPRAAGPAAGYCRRVPTAPRIAVFIATVLVAPSLAPARAHGDPPPRVAIVAADATADVALGVGVGLESPGLIVAGITGYALAAPVLHAAHGDPVGGGVSLGLRVGMPLVLGLGSGVISARHARGKSTRPGWVLLTGAAIGAVGAQLIDALVLSGARDRTAAPRVLSFGGAF